MNNPVYQNLVEGVKKLQEEVNDLNKKAALTYSNQISKAKGDQVMLVKGDEAYNRIEE